MGVPGGTLARSKLELKSDELCLKLRLRDLKLDNVNYIDLGGRDLC